MSALPGAAGASAAASPALAPPQGDAQAASEAAGDPREAPEGSPGQPTPPLFTQTNVRKPEYWQFAQLIAPSARLPAGKKAWTTHDATGIWCLRCRRKLNYQKGSSQSIRYHMETRHFDDLSRFREQLGRGGLVSSSPAASNPGLKRKFDEQRESSDSPLLSAASPARAMAVQSADTTPVRPAASRALQVASPSVATAPAPAPATPVAPAAATTPAPSESWSKNVARRGGFWGNPYWYDLQLRRRMPLAERTVSELVLALPPCDGKRVLDLCAGSGRASVALLDAYPTARVVLLDSSSERLSIASKRLSSLGLADQFQTITRAVDVSDASAPPLLPHQVDVVVGCLALHVLVERPKHYADGATTTTTHSAGTTSVPELYERAFRLVWRSLKPGGHVIFGDHVGQLPLFEQLLALSRVGFVDIDCAWRQDDSFVAGARKPSH